MDRMGIERVRSEMLSRNIQETLNFGKSSRRLENERVSGYFLMMRFDAESVQSLFSARTALISLSSKKCRVLTKRLHHADCELKDFLSRMLH
jgi:hypothetical protein